MGDQRRRVGGIVTRGDYALIKVSQICHLGSVRQASVKSEPHVHGNIMYHLLEDGYLIRCVNRTATYTKATRCFYQSSKEFH